MHSAPAWILILLMLACGGCTVIRQSQDLKETDARVKAKEAEYAAEQNQYQALQNETRQLTADLGRRRMTADELDRRLATLQKSNAQAASDNAQVRARQQALAAELDRSRAELAALKRSGTADIEAQRRQIDKLREEIRARLTVLEAAGS